MSVTINPVADLHTHTIASNHAYCTVTEMAKAAADAGLEGLGISDHAPELGDAPHLFYFQNLTILPRKIHDVLIFRGAEINILNEYGETDLPENDLAHLDYAIASLHRPIWLPKTKKAHTNALLNVLENPYVKILGHPDRCLCDIDMPAVLKRVKEYNRAIEINTHSLGMSDQISGRCAEILEMCKELWVNVVVNSDAHFSDRVGRFEPAIALIKAFDFPEELVVNTSIEKITEFFNILL